MKHRQLTRTIAFMEELESRVESEGGIQRQGATFGPRGCDGQIAPQLRVVGVPMGRHRRESIQRAAQYDAYEARLTAFRRGEGIARADQRAAERGALPQKVATPDSVHRSLPPALAPHELR